MSRETLVGIFYLLLTALCWGFVAPTVKVLTAEVDPYTISFFRVALASVVFVGLFVLRGGDWQPITWFSPWVIAGALGRAGNYVFYNTGLQHTRSNAATILAPVQAMGTVVLARWFLDEDIKRKWGGLALSLGGLLLIWWNGRGAVTLLDPRYIWGNLWLILSGLASALQFTSQKVLSEKRTSLEILLPVFFLSTAMTFPFAGTVGELSVSTLCRYAPLTWGLLLFLGLVLTGGSFFFLAEGYKRCEASTAVVITNSSAFLTLLWSAVLLNEPVSLVMIGGAIMGVIGTLAVIRAAQ